MSAEATARTAPSQRTDLLSLGAAAITLVLWASAFVGIRDAGAHLSPGALALGRLVVASIGLGLIVLARREPFPGRRDLPLIAVAGVLWLGAYNILLNAAEQRVDAGTAAMLVNVGPILIALLAGWLLGEGFPRTVFAGCAVAFVGVGVIATATSSGGSSGGIGALLCLAAALGYAGGVVAQKVALRRVSALQVTFLSCVFATVALLPALPWLVRDLADAPASSIAWVVYLGAFPTAIGFTTWAYALARMDAGRLGAMTYLVPALSILMGWVWLGETPPAFAFLGGALCLAGVLISRRK